MPGMNDDSVQPPPTFFFFLRLRARGETNENALAHEPGVSALRFLRGRCVILHKTLTVTYSSLQQGLAFIFM